MFGVFAKSECHMRVCTSFEMNSIELLIRGDVILLHASIKIDKFTYTLLYYI